METVAPHAAHATQLYCDQPTYYQNEDQGYWLTDSDRSSGYNTVYASDSYNSDYPVMVGQSPSGSYYYYGKWDICWTTAGSNSTGYYGVAVIANEATLDNWGVGQCSDYQTWASDAEEACGYYSWDFQCSGSTIYLYNENFSGYWTSFDATYPGWPNDEYIQNTSSAYQDTFTEVGTAPRFC